MLAWFYDIHALEKSENKGLALYAAIETENFAKLINLYEHVPTMLAMWHRETGYRSVYGDDGKSFGITQTLRKKEKKWREYWRLRDVELPSIDDPMTQIAFGVAEFDYCLQLAQGDEFDAVRRYNGGNNGGAGLRRARLYARKVFQSRKNIFGIDLPDTPAAKAAYYERDRILRAKPKPQHRPLK